jgi:phosphoserine phosphatase RsbU/P
MAAINVLLAGGTEQEYAALVRLFQDVKGNTYQLTQEQDEEKVASSLRGNAYEACLLAESVGSKKWIDIARRAADEGRMVPVITISPVWNPDLARETLSAHLADYLALDQTTPLQLDHHLRAAIDRIKIHDQLVHEQQLLQTLMDNMPDTIYFKDRESRFTHINQSQMRMLGLKNVNQAVGKTDFDFFDHAHEAYADEQRIMQTGAAMVDKQEKVRRADGEYRFVSATKVPIRAKSGDVIGTFGISRDITDRVKAEQELEVVKEHLENAMKKINEELEMARQIQNSLLPPGFPALAGIKAAAAYVPCSAIGGDLYEVIKLDDHRLGVLMFDVVGHGVPAALIAAMAKMIFGKHIARGLGPRDLLLQVNEDLVSHFNGKRYLAAYYGIIDVKEMTFLYSKGGHPPAMLLRPREKTVEHITTSEGIFIGLFPDGDFSEKKIQLQSGDRIVLFTDGLIETFNTKDEYFGMKKLESLLLETSAFPIDVQVSAVINSQKGYRETGNATDDITLLIVQIN